MSTETPLSVFLLFFSSLIVCLIGFPILISGIIFLAGANISSPKPVFIFSILFTVILIGWQFRKNYNLTGLKLAANFFISAAVIVASISLISHYYDKSWDGLTYHQMAVIKLSEGWNPIYERLPDLHLKSKYTGRDEDMHLYINHYGKGAEVFAAVVSGTTGNLESGKVFNLLLLISAFCSVFYLLNRIKKLKPFWNFMLAITAIFNPIAINQLFSYYVDGAVGSLLLILLCYLIFLMLPDNGVPKVSIFPSIFFLIVIIFNLKFTGPVYMAWFCFAFVALNIYLKTTALIDKFLIVLFGAGAVAVFVAGFNPYVVNTSEYGHPFYPLAGKNKIDVISGVMPQEFQHANPLNKFIKSTFSRCDNFDVIRPGKFIEFKLPFTFTQQEIKTFQSEDTRLCGFGVFWSGVLCLSVLGTVLLFARLSFEQRLYLFALLFAILGSALSIPESWWARFIPQLWLFPVVVCFFLMLETGNKLRQVSGRLILILLIVNSSIIAAAYTYTTVVNTNRTNAYFDHLKKSASPVYVYFDIFLPNAKKLQDRNIPYVSVSNASDLPCTSSIMILKMEFCAQRP